jgi:hypothetical protein
MADTIGLCQAKPPSHTTQPLTFGIGFIVALALPLSNAQWLVYKMELPTCLRQACMYARSGGVGLCALLCVVPLGSRRRGSWLPYICISSCHFLVPCGLVVQAIPPQYLDHWIIYFLNNRRRHARFEIGIYKEILYF